MTRGVRVLCARTARAVGRVRRERKNRIFSVSPQSRSLFSAFDCSRVLEYAKIRTVLQSTKTAKLLGGKDVNESIQSLGSFEFLSDNLAESIWFMGLTFTQITETAALF